MRETEINRRDFVSGLASAGTSAWLARHGAKLHTVAAYAASVSSEQPFDFFTPDQARDFDAISAQIIPSDDTPGAREAHVVRFADRYLATVAKDAQSGMRDNFKIVGDALAKKSSGSRSFAALSNEDQIAFLKELEKTHRNAFGEFRDLTMLGMFSHPVHGGNFNKAGWKLIGYDDRFSWVPPFGYYDRV